MHIYVCHDHEFSKYDIFSNHKNNEIVSSFDLIHQITSQN